MIRFGATFIGLALAAAWFAHLSEVFRFASLALLVLGLALLLAGREPWPHCCEHCPVYADRRARVRNPHPHGRARFEAAVLIEAARAEDVSKEPNPDGDPDR